MLELPGVCRAHGRFLARLETALTLYILDNILLLLPPCLEYPTCLGYLFPMVFLMINGSNNK